MVWLVVCRAIQGIGGGGIIQMVQIVISDIVPLEEYVVCNELKRLILTLYPGVGSTLASLELPGALHLLSVHFLVVLSQIMSLGVGVSGSTCQLAVLRSLSYSSSSS